MQLEWKTAEGEATPSAAVVQAIKNRALPEFYAPQPVGVNIRRIDAALYFLRPMTLDMTLNSLLRHCVMREWGNLVAVRNTLMSAGCA